MRVTRLRSMLMYAIGLNLYIVFVMFLPAAASTALSFL